MATRRKVGISTATSEAARRQLMQPVQCWEKVWILPSSAPAGSTVKIYKWVKTEKKQAFSDDEDETDAPLAPLPDEPPVDIDEELDQDDPATSVGPGTTSRAISEPINAIDDTPTPAPTKPHPLSISLAPPSPENELEPPDEVGDSLKPAPEFEPSLALSTVNETTLLADVTPNLDPDVLMSLDMSSLGPDGVPFESSHDLAQLQATDAMLGGEAMDVSEDPFAPPE